MKIKGGLRTILQLCWTTLKLARFIQYNVKGKCIKFPAIPGIFWNFCGGLKLQGITKKFHLYISGEIYWLLPEI